MLTTRAKAYSSSDSVV